MPVILLAFKPFHKIGKTVVREDTPANRGLVNAVRHLVTVEEVD